MKAWPKRLLNGARMITLDLFFHPLRGRLPCGSRSFPVLSRAFFCNTALKLSSCRNSPALLYTKGWQPNEILAMEEISRPTFGACLRPSTNTIGPFAPLLPTAVRAFQRRDRIADA